SCGGCDWQHLRLADQRAAKQAILGEQLTHMGRQERVPLLPTAGAEAWGYRSTARLHIAGELMGFYAAGGRKIVPLEQCPLLDPALNEAIAALRGLLPIPGLREATIRASTTTGRLHALLDGQGGPAWGQLARDWRAAVPALSGVSAVARNGWRMLAGAPYLEERMGDVLLRVSPTSFFQANVERARAVLAELERLLALTPEAALLDAFCGVGTFVLPLGRRVSRAWGIEENPAAIADAQASASAHSIANVTLIAGKVEDQIGELAGRIDIAVLDPPRRGCEESTLAALLRMAPRQIAYVSCHPGTLARDIRALSAGGYGVRSAQPFDFFPQTAHIESLVLMEREPA
ncbi:MAG TPA: 23S rRNA (uracil(1939)-C(5))-methyltransferase RlmD, partial [Herpetosiphonaceae bacterium]